MTTTPAIPTSDAKEPVLLVGGSVGTVAGILGLISYINPNLLTGRTPEIILMIAGLVLPIVTAIFARGFVWSPHSVKELVDEAVTNATRAKATAVDPLESHVKGLREGIDKPPYNE